MGSRAAGPVVYVVPSSSSVLALGGGWWAAALRPDTRPPLTSALDVLPVRTNVVGFTDWSQVRQAVGLGTVDTAAEREELEGTSATRDLSTRSVVGRTVEEMHDILGWSPADIEWEAYGQDPRRRRRRRSAGRVHLLRPRFATSCEPPDTARTVRRGRVSKRTVLPDITTHIALVPRQRLVVMSDQAVRVPEVLDVVHGRARSLASSRVAAGTAQALSGSDNALMQARRARMRVDRRHGWRA